MYDTMTHNTKGQALLIVISFLAMFFIIGVAFFLLSQTERLNAIKNIDAVRARYVAEAGAAYAGKLLEADRLSTCIDSPDENWSAAPAGDEADADGDGINESRWRTLLDSSGAVCGRFALKITDEASKININTADREILERLFARRQVDVSYAEKIIAGRPYDAIEQVGALVGAEVFAKIRSVITAHSREREAALDGSRRIYLNSSNPNLIVDAFQLSGVADARRKAAMLIDASDTDAAQTILSEFMYDAYAPAQVQESGDWAKRAGWYEAPAGGRAGVFVWTNTPVADGEYECYVFGKGTDDIVGVIGEEYLRSGDRLRAHKIKVAGGSFSMAITPARDSLSRLSHVRLSSAFPCVGLTRVIHAGTEVIVINELMALLKNDYGVDAADIPSGATRHYRLKPELNLGYYHAQVFAKNAGGLVGSVTIQGRTAADMRDGDFFPYAVEIGAAGEVSIDVRNDSPAADASLKTVRLSQQPDNEYIELLNLSSEQVDVSDFIIETYTPAGELVRGWPARIPKGTVMQPYQYLALAAHNDDSQSAPAKLKSGGVSFSRQWGFSGVNLVFDDYARVIDLSYDLLPDDGGIVILRDARGFQTDAVKYSKLQLLSFRSMERGDPSARIDSSGDGLIDGWYPSQSALRGTPGVVNENQGMYTNAGADIARHTPADIVFFNRPLNNLHEASQVSSGGAWGRLDIGDLARLCDKFAYEAVSLDPSGRYQGGGFSELGGMFVSSSRGDAGRWRFDNVPAGAYWLGLEGDAAQGAPVEITVDIGSHGGNVSAAARLFSGSLVPYGQIAVSRESAGSITVGVTNKSGKPLRIRRVMLEPVSVTEGRVNVNTAPAEVLAAAAGSDALAQKIIAGRALGDKGNMKLGVGDVILLDGNLLKNHRLLSVKSDVYQIFSRGEYLLHDKPSAYVFVRVILDRADSN